MTTKRRRRVDDLAHDPVVRDGDAITFPLTLMDGKTVYLGGDDSFTGAVLTAAVIEAGRRSGMLMDQHEETKAVDTTDQAYAAYNAQLQDAWRRPAGTPAAQPPAPAPVADGGSDHVEAAYRAYDARLQDAWRTGR
ncbi:hypothetical protein [Rhodoplanes elegans]|uniref:hypothetical protein n=1 Tax=Rhodoplanes elegans TaxID=29408 RepID=UPI0011B9480E|nr:hypothetical protein [Rhodoplanes elegans]